MYTNQMEQKADLLKLANAGAEEIDEYIKMKKNLPWEAEVMGGKLPHMLAGKGNTEGLQKLYELNPKIVNSIGTIKKRTPIFTALNSCHIPTVRYLVKTGANINHQDIDGNTPILFAAKSGCYGGVLLLKEQGADIALVNKKKESLDQLVADSGLDEYWEHRDRNLASKKENKSKD